MGTPEFAVPSLERLAQTTHELAAVVTRPDRPQGRGQRVASPPVKTAAERLGLPVLQPESLKDPAALEQLRGFGADLFVVVAFVILPRTVLGIPERGCINVHPSLLPRYRGAAPINWAVIRGERETGITTFLLTPRVDGGEILYQQETAIGADETAGELHDRLMVMGAEVLAETVDALDRGDTTPRPQPEAGVTRAPKLSREDGRIDWESDGESIRNLVRGTNPFPGAFTVFRGRELKVHRVTPKAAAGVPGEVLRADGKEGVAVGTGSDALELVQVQPAGKRRMSGSGFVRGYRVAVGERMGP